MSIESKDEAAAEIIVERRIIQIDSMPDQAGITAALRRAFAERPLSDCLDDDDPFEQLLKQIH